MSVMDRFSLAGQVGIVTGGGQGLGRAFCRAFAEAGADLVVAEINPDTGSQVAEEVRNLGRRALCIPTDVASKASGDAMVIQTLAEFGRVDFIMNNAGTNVWGNAEDLSEEAWRKVFALNVDGLFYCCQAAARPMMAQGGGRIINIASMSGLIVNRPQAQTPYNTAKAAVIHLTKSLAAEWAPHNIRVNAIAPGYMSNVYQKFGRPEVIAQWQEHIPMKRLGDPDELGPAAVFLASDASSYMTGAVLVMDGGYTIW